MVDMSIFKQDDFERIKEHLKIDRYRLDDESIELPSIVQECAEIAEVASNRAFMAEQTYKSLLAIANAELREGAGKKTVADIAHEAALRPEVRDAQRQAAARRTSANHWRALLDSLKVKQSSLKRLGELVAAGYMTKPAAEDRPRHTIGGRGKPVLRHG